MADEVGFVRGEPSHDAYVQDLEHKDSKAERMQRRAEFVHGGKASAEVAIAAGEPIPKMVCPSLSIFIHLYAYIFVTHDPPPRLDSQLPRLPTSVKCRP